MNDTITPAEVFSPGEYLRDELEARGWTAAEFADIIGRPAQVVSEILNAKKEITPETAVELGAALGTSAEVWLNLEAAHRLAHANRGNVSAVERRARLRELVPLREVQKRGWLPITNDLDELEVAVRDLLAIDDVSSTPLLAVAARRAGGVADYSPEQLAWVSRVRQRAVAMEPLKEFDVAALRSLAEALVSRIHDPTDLKYLEAWTSGCGVRLILEMPLRSSKIDGVSLFLDDGPVIGLSTRGDRMDGFVFTLLHEIAHLVLGHVTTGGVTLDEDLDPTHSTSLLESEANEQASRWIFDEDLHVAGPIGARSILMAARDRGVHPCFVVGRLQQQGDLPWSQQRRFIPKVRPFLPELDARS